MKISGISFSHAENSLQTRGLSLVDHYVKFKNLFSMKDFDIPVCYSNKPDGIVPNGVLKLDQVLEESDALVFSISEAGGHYCAAFKNVMDWLIVKNRFNSQLGSGYSMSGKCIYVMTFTPTHKDSGDRHFEMTRFILEQKFGAKVRQMHVFNKSWEGVLPGHYDFVKKQSQMILDDIATVGEPLEKKEAQVHYDVSKWTQQYEEWDKLWTES